jgi:hypothetical protein
MDSWRYSLTDLLLYVLRFVLLAHALSVMQSSSYGDSAPLAGLSLGVFVFSIVCGLMGDTSRANLLHSAALYAWGRTVLWLVATSEPGLLARCLLAALGVVGIARIWFGHPVPPSLTDFRSIR